MSCMVVILIIVIINEIVLIRVVKRVSELNLVCARTRLKYLEVCLNSTKDRMSFEYIYLKSIRTFFILFKFNSSLNALKLFNFEELKISLIIK